MVDQSTEPTKRYCQTLGYEIIDVINDGQTYTDRNGKIRSKKNLGCDFWRKKNGQTQSVEAKCKIGNMAGLVPHQIDRLIEGGVLIVWNKKDNTFRELLWNDIKNRNDILRFLTIKNARSTIGQLRLYY
jgi:hypothetical protein